VDLWQQLERAATPPVDWRSRAQYHGSRFALALALAVLTQLLFPSSPASEVPLYEVGSVATDNVIAPFAFGVKKDAIELRRERAEMARSAEPILVYSPA
jgi:hypothetical protein